MARKKGAAKAANHERWLLTYADMITLLMIFFIVLWSMSSADVEKFRKISAALSRAFSIDILTSQEDQSAAVGGGTFEPRLAAYNAFKSQIGAVAKALNVTEDTAVNLSREGVVITLSGNFLFESGRADLRPDAYPVLDAVAATLQTMPNDVRVSGHTDNVPIETPLYASNWELSAARALSIVKYLTASGVEPQRLSAVGQGEFHPVVPNDSRANRAKNRRAELLIVFADGADAAGRRDAATPPLPAPAGLPTPVRSTPAAQEGRR